MIAIWDRRDGWVGLSSLSERLKSEPSFESSTNYESEMALFPECTPRCAQKVLDTADTVRDGDFATNWAEHWTSVAKASLVLPESLEGEIASNRPNAFVPVYGALANGKPHFRIGAKQSHFSVPRLALCEGIHTKTIRLKAVSVRISHDAGQ